MKIGCFLIMIGYGGLLLAQTDSPPELEHPTVPDHLPAIEQLTARNSGKLKIDFHGASAFRTKTLRSAIARQIEAIETQGLDEPNAYDIAFFLETFYRNNGYRNVEVSFRILGAWQLDIAINQGPIFRIGTVNIDGNAAFDIQTLKNYLLGPTRERYPRIRKDVLLPFVQADIESGTDLVRRLYQSKGFLEVIVDAPLISFDGTTANISMRIQEGIQYRLEQIRFIGLLIDTREALQAEIQKHTEGLYTDGRIEAAQRALEDLYRKHGYFNVQVTTQVEASGTGNGNMIATFRIAEGSRYHFGGATVTGTQGLKPEFIQKRLRNLHGKTYDPVLLNKSFRQLIDTGLFTNLRIVPEAVGDDELRLDVTVEEAKPKEFGVGLGFATFEGGIVSLNYMDRNLLNTGRALALDVEANQRGFNGEVLYTDRWLFDSDYQFRSRLYGLTTMLKGYSKNEVGFQPTLTRYITEHWKISGFVLTKYVALYDVLVEPQNLVGPSSYGVNAFGISQALDYRNNPMLPTQGFIFSSALDFAPNELSEIAYVRALSRFSCYFPITKRTILAFGARAGIISPLQANNLPIDERFFNGGATTVRSFSELTLGPKDRAGYPIGGQAFTVFNVEYTFPIIGDLQGAAFMDAGNVVADAASFGFEDMRYGLGVGLRYNLPIGALRLDYGLNPNPQDGEAQGAFHFAVGVAF